MTSMKRYLVVPRPKIYDATTGQVSPTVIAQPSAWGWLPALALSGALGLQVVVWAVTGARHSAAWAQPLFWAGLLLIFAPAALRLFSTSATRGERIGLVAGLGVGLYLVKVLEYPLAFTFFDELAHWRTAHDMLAHQQLFWENPVLPVSPFYPGLESVTVALAQISGLGIFHAGVLVLLVARLVLMMALFLLYEQVGQSARLAGIALLVYMTQPNFLFFGAQFGYESLALPVAALVVWAAVRRDAAPLGARVGLTLVVALGTTTVVATHHITSYALVGLLGLWTLTAAKVERDTGKIGPRGTLLVALVATLAWTVFVASRTVGYLAPQLSSAVEQFVRLMAGDTEGRQLFRSSTGDVHPLWEQLNGFASVGLILLVLPWGFYQGWKRYRHNSVALVLGYGALAYPVTLALRLTPGSASEIANRTSAFVFVGLAFVLAVGINNLPRLPRLHWMWAPVFAGWVSVIFTGGVIVGWARWARLPGPYLVIADPRSIEAQGVAAANWSRDTLGPGQRMIADRINRLLMASYGDQRLVTNYGDQVRAATVLLATQWEPREQAIVQQGQVRYVVVDQRLTQGLPVIGAYIERGEPGAATRTKPLELAAITKYDTLPNVGRIFDSGDIVIYDIGAISHAP